MCMNRNWSESYDCDRQNPHGMVDFMCTKYTFSFSLIVVGWFKSNDSGVDLMCTRYNPQSR